MIITVTLNAAIDKSLSVPNFRLGRRHRTVEQTTLPGGKGVNVARTLKTLGQPVIATGFAGGATGTRIVEALTDESILNDFVRIREESRTNTAVLDPTNGEQTEINERGPAVSGRELELFRDKLLYLARGAAIVIFAGSLPRNVDADVYADLIKELRKLGLVVVIDTDGDPLRHAVRAEPHVVSPNVLEAEELVGHEFNDDEDRIIAVREIASLGAQEAIMTVPDGCFAQVIDDGEPRAVPRATSSRARRSPRSAAATRSSPATSRRATAASRRPSACASASPAAPSPCSGSAPGCRPAEGRAARRRGRGRAPGGAGRGQLTVIATASPSEEAIARAQDRVQSAIARPTYVQLGEKRYTLTPAEAGVRIDVQHRRQARLRRESRGLVHQPRLAQDHRRQARPERSRQRRRRPPRGAPLRRGHRQASRRASPSTPR